MAGAFLNLQSVTVNLLVKLILGFFVSPRYKLTSFNPSLCISCKGHVSLLHLQANLNNFPEKSSQK